MEKIRIAWTGMGFFIRFEPLLKVQKNILIFCEKVLDKVNGV
jgi:hypothetical protein